jgi:hypothetical protein
MELQVFDWRPETGLYFSRGGRLRFREALIYIIIPHTGENWPRITHNSWAESDHTDSPGRLSPAKSLFFLPGDRYTTANEIYVQRYCDRDRSFLPSISMTEMFRYLGAPPTNCAFPFEIQKPSLAPGQKTHERAIILNARVIATRMIGAASAL